ncbi:hypothetical protein BJV82DRAFT_593209 [Fennellomyces sp. T-0311]|nr:hypothetical protein BJV82DRAFT_593209 [Fennellomyces sp. T-0311]
MNAHQQSYFYPTPPTTSSDHYYTDLMVNQDIASLQYSYNSWDISAVTTSPWSGTRAEIPIDSSYYHEISHLGIPTIGASAKLTPAETSLTSHDTILYYSGDSSPSAYNPSRVTSSTGSGDSEHRCRWLKCGVSTATLDQLILHIRDDHVGSGKPAYFCYWAGCPRSKKPFTKRHKMHNHMRTHTGERPFQCTVQGCTKRFSRPDSLSTHIKTHSNIRPYHCSVPGCGKAYFHSRSLRKHTRSHEEQQQQQQQQQQQRQQQQQQTRHSITSYPPGPDPRFFPVMDLSSVNYI